MILFPINHAAHRILHLRLSVWQTFVASRDRNDQRPGRFLTLSEDVS